MTSASHADDQTVADPRTSPETDPVRSPRSPHVGVVLVTHNRPALMRRALASVLAQAYDGDITVVVVYDRSEPELELVSDAPGRQVEVIVNQRHPGLAGARNTGVLHLGTDLVGFCDDDDEWLPGKLTAQVERLTADPEAEFVTTAMQVSYDGRTSLRLAGKDVVTLTDMARSRMAMLHSTSFLFRRAAMVDGFGLVDETLPGSMAEDWDLLLRAARQAPIQHVDEPLVLIQWGATSYFNDAWNDKNEAHAWLAEHHPEMRADRVGAGLLYGKLAFGHAVVREAAGVAVLRPARGGRELARAPDLPGPPRGRRGVRAPHPGPPQPLRARHLSPAPPGRASPGRARPQDRTKGGSEPTGVTSVAIARRRWSAVSSSASAETARPRSPSSRAIISWWSSTCSPWASRRGTSTGLRPSSSAVSTEPTPACAITRSASPMAARSSSAGNRSWPSMPRSATAVAPTCHSTSAPGPPRAAGRAPARRPVGTRRCASCPASRPPAGPGPAAPAAQWPRRCRTASPGSASGRRPRTGTARRVRTPGSRLTRRPVMLGPAARAALSM